MGHARDTFREALAGKKIPILTLDHRWHQLFTQAQVEVPPDVRKAEAALNGLLKKQGNLNHELKEARREKKRAIEEIIVLAKEMGDSTNPKLERRMDEKKRLIREYNEQMERCQDELRLIPEEIDRVNRRLMLITMDICYRRMAENTRVIDAIDQWIREIRMEIKKKLVRKEEGEQANYELYSYMHSIFGADVMEIFDLKYNPGEKKKIADGDSE